MDNATSGDDRSILAELNVPDPSDMSPLCDEEEFFQLVGEVVANDAPRLFAVVAEYGNRVDARIAAWGLAFETHAYVVSVDGYRRYLVESPESVLHHFRVGDRITSHLVWHDSSTNG